MAGEFRSPESNSACHKSNRDFIRIEDKVAPNFMPTSFFAQTFLRKPEDALHRNSNLWEEAGKVVKVHETGGTVLQTKIASIDEVSVLVQDGSKPIVAIPYDKVTAVKGPGLSKGARIGIGVGTAVLVSLVIVVAYAASHVLSGLKTVPI